MANRAEIRVESLRLEQNAGNQRVAAEVNGELLYFESPQASLRPAPEAFASALLVPALERGADLVFEQPLDPVFLAGVRRITETLSGWWGYSEIALRAPNADTMAPLPAEASSVPDGTTTLCFSGGADSFYSLLYAEERVDSLAFVEGFDIQLDDRERTAAFLPSLDQIAKEVSAQPLILRTNLRDHPQSRRVSWERAHGGALAAIGHLLAGVQRMIVAASFPSCFPHPWGSRWDLDPHWSSTHMQVVHHGSDQWRADKLRALASSEIVRSHLRVCWEHRNREMNCSQCEKCVRTMLTLAQCGALAAFEVFDSSRPLAARVRALEHVAPILRPVYAGFLEPEIDPETTRALQTLLAVSGSTFDRRRPRSGWKKRFKRVLFRS